MTARLGAESDLDVVATPLVGAEQAEELKKLGWSLEYDDGEAQSFRGPSGLHSRHTATPEKIDNMFLPFFKHYIEVPDEGIDIEALVRQGACNRGLGERFCGH